MLCNVPILITEGCKNIKKDCSTKKRKRKS
jgi:hypothetical protein